MRFGFLPLAAALVLQPLGASAQGPASDVRVFAFLAPEGRTLRLLVRLPMAAMTGVESPLDRLPIDIYEGDRRLDAPRIAAIKVSLPSDTSFASYESALSHVTRPAPPEPDLVASQALYDVLLEYQIDAETSPFAIEPRFDTPSARAVTSLTLHREGRGERVFEFQGNPGLVRLEPRWFHAAERLAVDGFTYVLRRIDALLLLLCLVMPFRQVRQVVAVAGAFIVAQPISVIASAYGMAPDVLWFPSLIATLMAASVVYVALENIVSVTLRRRTAMAFGLGFVHGFGFSFGLRDSLQFAGDHLLLSAVSFDVGVALAQLLVLSGAVPALALTFRHGLGERPATIVISALVTHSAWHWTLDRGTVLRRYPVQLPVLDAALLAFVLRWVMLAVALVAVMWLVGAFRAARSEGMALPRWRRT